MANLSVLSPGKLFLDIFGKHMLRSFFGILESKNPYFFQVNFVGGGQSEGVPHEVFGPWVRWGRGQVISDLSRRRRNVDVGPKKNVEQYFSKNVQNSGHLDEPFGLLIFNFFQCVWVIV